jgi:hypothetical protein
MSEEAKAAGDGAILIRGWGIQLVKAHACDDPQGWKYMGGSFSASPSAWPHVQ